jgi:hypothetical protein
MHRNLRPHAMLEPLPSVDVVSTKVLFRAFAQQAPALHLS